MTTDLTDAALDALVTKLRNVHAWQEQCHEAADAIAALRERVRELEAAPTTPEVEWFHRFLNCAPFGPPPSEIARAHDILRRLDLERNMWRRGEEIMQRNAAEWKVRAERAEADLARVTAERDEARRDAGRWHTIEALMVNYVEVTLIQEEDGRWGIHCYEGIEVADGEWFGNDPPAVVDAIAASAKEK